MKSIIIFALFALICVASATSLLRRKHRRSHKNRDDDAAPLCGADGSKCADATVTHTACPGFDDANKCDLEQNCQEKDGECVDCCAVAADDSDAKKGDKKRRHRFSKADYECTKDFCENSTVTCPADTE